MAKGNRPKRPSNEIIIQALEASAGLVKQAAIKLGFSRRALNLWIQHDPELQEAVKDIRESMMDLAESVLFKNMKSNKEEVAFKAAIWYLERMGKHRGFVLRQEYTGKDGETLNITIEDARNRAIEKLKADES